jgi:protein-L-isoaspartate(D-aspartate) O-methyltransferase
VGEDSWAEARERMVRSQIASRDILDRRVLEAMRRVPRHCFVPERWRDQAYDDHPLPIGHEQTISQPYIVALMSELARVKPGDRVLEVGTGSGYQTAVLAELGAEIYSIEVIESLSQQAAAVLERLGYHKVSVRSGDGYGGWPEQAPFAAVVVTAAPPTVPAPLTEQLAVGGRLVVPVGRFWQDLLVIKRAGGEFEEKRVLPVRFVPMVGEAQRRG